MALPMALQILGTGFKVASAMQQGRNAQSEAEFNRYQLELDALRQKTAGRERANQRLRDLDADTANNLAIFGFLGREDRSVKAFLEAQKRVAYEDADILLTQSDMEARQTRLKGEMEMVRGRNAAKAGLLGATTSIVSGLQRYEQVKIGD